MIVTEPVFHYAISPKNFAEMVCVSCGRKIGYAHDIEHDVPQSVFVCEECFEKVEEPSEDM